MGEKTKISWCDSTYNPWIGCTKVSTSAPDGDRSKGGACDNCYAEELDRVRFSKTMGGATKEVPIVHWGAGAPRYRTAAGTRNAPHRWNKAREIAMGEFALGKRERPAPHRVFCASLADVFDNEVPKEWRDDVWSLIVATRYLDWLLVTKRIGNVERMMPPAWIQGEFPKHMRLLVSGGNQFEAERDIGKLIRLATRNGISSEPALGPLNLDWTVSIPWARGSAYGGRDYSPIISFIGWVIIGGESKQGDRVPREFHVRWARDVIRYCKQHRRPVFMKQCGSRPVWESEDGRPIGCALLDRGGADPAEWPQGLSVQEFPS